MALVVLLAILESQVLLELVLPLVEQVHPELLVSQETPELVLLLELLDRQEHLEIPLLLEVFNHFQAVQVALLV